jgi:hypothetical protein
MTGIVLSNVTTGAVGAAIAVTGAVKSNGSTTFGQAATSDLSDVTASTSFTPADASVAALTFSGVSVKYTKIGNMVFVYGVLTYPVTADGNSAGITLPVNVPNVGYAQGPSIIATSVAATVVMGQPTQNTNKLLFYNAIAFSGAITNAQLSTKTIQFIVSYPAS